MTDSIDPGFLVLGVVLALSTALVVAGMAVPLALLGFMPAASLALVTAFLYLRRTAVRAVDEGGAVYTASWSCVFGQALIKVPVFATIAMVSQLVGTSSVEAALGVSLAMSAADWIWVVALLAVYDILICFGPVITRQGVNDLLR